MEDEVTWEMVYKMFLLVRNLCPVFLYTKTPKP